MKKFENYSVVLNDKMPKDFLILNKGDEYLLINKSWDVIFQLKNWYIQYEDDEIFSYNIIGEWTNWRKIIIESGLINWKTKKVIYSWKVIYKENKALLDWRGYYYKWLWGIQKDDKTVYIDKDWKILKELKWKCGIFASWEYILEDAIGEWNKIFDKNFNLTFFLPEEYVITAISYNLPLIAIRWTERKYFNIYNLKEKKYLLDEYSEQITHSFIWEDLIDDFFAINLGYESFWYNGKEKLVVQGVKECRPFWEDWIAKVDFWWGNNFWYVNKKGEVIIKWLAHINDFMNGFAYVRIIEKNGAIVKWVIDKKGEIIFKWLNNFWQFGDIWRAVVIFEDDTAWIINTKGEIIFKGWKNIVDEFIDIELFNKEFWIVVYDNDKYDIINIMDGKIIEKNIKTFEEAKVKLGKIFIYKFFQ